MKIKNFNEWNINEQEESEDRSWASMETVFPAEGVPQELFMVYISINPDHHEDRTKDLIMIDKILNDYPSLMLKKIHPEGNETTFEFIGSKEDCDKLAYASEGEKGSFEKRYTDERRYDA